MEILPADANGWIRLSASPLSNRVYSIEASGDFQTWQPIAITHDGLFQYPDAATPLHSHRHYRLVVSNRGATNDWRNQILFPEDSFQSAFQPGGGVRWIKLAIVFDDPARVIYQDSDRYPFHYDFARLRIPRFQGMSREAFDAVSLRRANQEVVLGAVLFPPTSNFLEYGVQFVGLDPYPPEDVRRWFELVRATVHPVPRATAAYLPTFEQRASAEASRDYFESNGIPITSIDRWVTVNHCYSPGWAFGQLKFFTAGEIDAAYADGRLRPEDILLTDGVPAETPLVAGIISLTPSTPNSHVAILARSFGIPFVHLPDEAERARALAWVGREVILRAVEQFDRTEVRLIDAEGRFDAGQRQELLALKEPPPIAYEPKAEYGAFSASTDALKPADIRYFGGKAANYGLLRRTIPEHAPPAIAFSFDLWDEFMGQTLPGGNTLREEIALRLAPYTNYPPEIASLKATLASIRDLIRGPTQFTASQQQAITNALAGFTPGRNIRFRSSTNVEDGEHFTGAGLYDSFSGCLLDDLDGDGSGPSHCDPTENNERGVFRAIRRVYASFYNDNAFLERLRHGVDEREVGMGVLVHHSFPDHEELANGVAALRFNVSVFSTNVSGDLVTQLGAVPVTNPDGTAAPEVVDAAWFNGFSSLHVEQHSSLVPLGGHVMSWEGDYQGFLSLFAAVGAGYKQLHPSKETFHLDFEYKKDLNLGRVVKQVREIPVPGLIHSVAPFLVDEPVEYTVAQEEFGDVFANHRLKSRWSLRTVSKRLTAPNLMGSIYGVGQLELASGTNRLTLEGPLSAWPESGNDLQGNTALDFWSTGDGASKWQWRLETDLILEVSGAVPPIVTQRDFDKRITVKYATPVPSLDFSGKPVLLMQETARLAPRPGLHPGAILREQQFSRTNAASGDVVTIETSYYWPNPPTGVVAGYTAPLIEFVETRITGLTPEPLVLRDYYSQTYRPGHHNFSEEFIFEPALEPGLPPESIEALNQANFKLLHVYFLGTPDVALTVLGLDGTFRRL